MELYKIALILLLVGCVVALFFIWLKNRPGSSEPEAEEDQKEPDPVGPVVIPVVDPVPAPAPTPVPIPIPDGPSNQHTIYAFERNVPVYMCPRCDGENSPMRSVCCICGFEFRKGVGRL